MNHFSQPSIPNCARNSASGIRHRRLSNTWLPAWTRCCARSFTFPTDALTGWDENTANPYLANWPELEAEREGAGRVKQEKPILVILGNPPYNAYAGVSPEEEQGLVEVYKGIYQREKKNKKGEDLFD